MRTNGAFALLVAFAVCVSHAEADEFRITEVRALAPAGADRLDPHTIAFTDHREDEIADSATVFIPFEDWARAAPTQKRYLGLYPSFVEPMVKLTEDGASKPTKEKLKMYVAEARFRLDKPARSIDLAHYATIAFLERMDPKITHRAISAAEIDAASNRNPDRSWCEAKANVLCIESRYELEGKLPAGVRLANQLVEKNKKIDDYLLFQSELRILSPSDLDQPGLMKLTHMDAPIAGVIEQNIFHVNQVMQFGKFLALFQETAEDPGKTVVTAFIVLAIKTRVLENKNKYANVPVLRNLVPGQVLLGKSSFNTGNSISAGLPVYARNQIKAVAGILDQN